jgi:hypothetical protein
VHGHRGHDQQGALQGKGGWWRSRCLRLSKGGDKISARYYSNHIGCNLHLGDAITFGVSNFKQRSNMVSMRPHDFAVVGGTYAEVNLQSQDPQVGGRGDGECPMD